MSETGKVIKDKGFGLKPLAEDEMFVNGIKLYQVSGEISGTKAELRFQFISKRKINNAEEFTSEIKNRKISGQGKVLYSGFNEATISNLTYDEESIYADYTASGSIALPIDITTDISSAYVTKTNCIEI